MPVYRLSEEVIFPPPEHADHPEGLLAVGGDLRPERLLAAYGLGIFPWYAEGQPILWWSPDPRLILEPDGLHVSKSLQKVLKKGAFKCTFDTAFADVIKACASVSRRGEDGTWITPEMKDAYFALHELGFAHSVEVWADDRLVGGLYGVSLGGSFFGESMFANVANASKVALVHLVDLMKKWDFHFIDCQISTPHLVTMGAFEVPRDDFLFRLNNALQYPTKQGFWTNALEE